jgi:hypothetical protein
MKYCGILRVQWSLGIEVLLLDFVLLSDLNWDVVGDIRKGIKCRIVFRPSKHPPSSYIHTLLYIIVLFLRLQLRSLPSCAISFCYYSLCSLLSPVPHQYKI